VTYTILVVVYRYTSVMAAYDAVTLTTSVPTRTVEQDLGLVMAP